MYVCMYVALMWVLSSPLNISDRWIALGVVSSSQQLQIMEICHF